MTDTPEEKMKHSKLPWRLHPWQPGKQSGVFCTTCGDWAGGERYLIERNHGAKRIACTSIAKSTSEDKANAEFIITACNSHYTLTAQRDALREALRPFANFACDCGECYNCKALAAIELCEVKP